ncbi:mycothione reductase [Corynebacterium sp.]|uniref:mycothione reductase n=1 Tax=Corynebacterium sp. TaxID=1720 RepID=UPI0026DAD61F|nr:mycothione reductase [Corynebacterium sp.]MDO5032480.1 mycothione reductase [Corynebacterium sp.]
MNNAQNLNAQHFDLVIIGTGSGNSIPSPEFDDKSIAIIEKGTFGGTCLNVGCIPTKMYVYSADTALSAREGEKLGVHAHVDSIDWDTIVERVFAKRVDPIAQGGEAYRRGEETPNITVFDQHARFIGPKTLQCGEDVITGDQIVLAAGARPNVPAVFADSDVKIYTNEDIMRMPKQPESLIVVGGGFIAMEFAHVFDGLGTKVTVVNRSETLLRFLDEDLSSRFNEIARQRYEVRIGGVKKVERRTAEATDAAQAGVRLTLDDDSVVEADAILVATGRIPNGDLMNLEASGIEMHEDGRVKVDEFGRTTCEGVWALGDVSSPYMLKHVANAEQRAVAHNLLHPENLQPMPHEHVPSAIFTHPQIATVGLTEAQAREQGYDITVKVQNFGDVAYGWAMEDTTGICKLVADRATGKLLGAHLMGPQSSTLIQQLITAMAYDLDMRTFARTQYWIHPALPEVVENAVLGLDWQ